MSKYKSYKIELYLAIKNSTINREEQLAAVKDYTDQANLYRQQGESYTSKIAIATTRKAAWEGIAASNEAYGGVQSAVAAKEKVKEMERDIEDYTRIKSNYGTQHGILVAEANKCLDKAVAYKVDIEAKTEELRRLEEFAVDDLPTGFNNH